MLTGSRTSRTHARDDSSGIQYERLVEAAVESESSDVPTAQVTAGMVDLQDSPEPGFMLAMVTAEPYEGMIEREPNDRIQKGDCLPPSGDDADPSDEDRNAGTQSPAGTASEDSEDRCTPHERWSELTLPPNLCPLNRPNGWHTYQNRSTYKATRRMGSVSVPSTTYRT